MNDEDLPDSYFEDHLKKIEADIHGSANRIRHAMNQALIAVGVRNNVLRRRAVSAARQIGEIEVDHGDTSCKTPDAVAYIKKVIERRA